MRGGVGGAVKFENTGMKEFALIKRRQMPRPVLKRIIAQ